METRFLWLKSVKSAEHAGLQILESSLTTLINTIIKNTKFFIKITLNGC